MPNTVYPDAPRVAVGAVVIRANSVLLVRRGRPPARSVWAVPGGSVALGETLFAAVEREVREETAVTVRAREPVHAFDVIERDAAGGVRFHYVVVDVLADWVTGEPIAASDAAEARWVALDEIVRLDVSDETRRLVERLTKRGAA